LLLAELESNRVDSPEVVRRMEGIRTAIEELEREWLAKTETTLLGALKIVRDDIDKHGDVLPDKVQATAQKETSDALANTGDGQDEVVRVLEALLGDLEEFDSYRRFAREVSRLRNEQTAIGKETQELQPKTLSKSPRDLSPQELAALRRAAQKQTELARQIDKLVGRMGDARTKLAESQPLAASTLADALDTAKRAAISSQMLDTARSIEQNQLGNAGQQQSELGESLSELQDILSSRKEHELGRRIKQLRESAEELNAVQKQLKGLKQRTQDAAKIGNEAERKRQLERLSKEQKRLSEEAQRLGRKLERLQSEKAGQQVGQAGGKAGEAGQSSEQGATDKALDDLAQAAKLLEEAQQQLQQDIAQAEQDLFFEQVAKLEQAIQGLVSRQQTVINETERLEGLKTNQQGEWTPSQRTSVRSVTEQERDLVSETTAFAQKLKEAAAFGLALEGAVREMSRATARLDRFLTDTATQDSERIALARLQQLLEALKPEPPGDDQPMEQPMGNDGGGNQPQMPPGDAVHLLAELKLLKLMQQEINRRTTELEKLRAAAQVLTAEQEEELDDLSVEQGKLADLVLALSEKAAKQAAAAANAGTPPPTEDKSKRPGNNPLDDELNKSLDNELLPGRQ
jgi:DNA repair exonuclease SbcCD ATPase subunit